MNFQNPAAFLWALPLGGIIVTLYLLRMRRKDLVVPATFLWPERTDEIRANSLFQKLKFNWLMVLQLLALALLLFGLARWQTKQTGLTGAVTVAVIDTSASMQAVDEGGSRFELALNQIEGMIGGMQAGDQLALIEAGPVPRVIFSLSSDPAAMRRRLSEIRPTDAEGSMGEALQLASGIVGQMKGAKIVLVSDGCFDPVENFSPGEAELVFAQVGQMSDNLAVQSLGTTEGPEGPLVYVGVRNFGSSAKSAPLTLLADGKVFLSTTVAVDEGKTWGRTALVPAGASLVEARLDVKDALEADNWMAAPVGRGASLRVLLVSGGNVFLERALALDPRVTLDKAASVPETERSGGGRGVYDLVVFDGVEPVGVKAGSVLSFGRAPAGMPVTGSGSSALGAFVQQVEHPLTDGVDFSQVFVDKGVPARATGTARVLVESERGPLLLVNEGVQKQVFVTFGVFDSDFPLNYGFPIFLSNVLDFVTRADHESQVVVRTGQTVGFPAEEGGRLRLERPDGSVEQIEPVSGRFLVREFTRAGRYVIGEGEGARPVYVNLRSDRESDVSPQNMVSVGGGSVASQEAFVRFADLWRPLLVLALLVLAGEWWFYARRS